MRRHHSHLFCLTLFDQKSRNGDENIWAVERETTQTTPSANVPFVDAGGGPSHLTNGDLLEASETSVTAHSAIKCAPADVIAR